MFRRQSAVWVLLATFIGGAIAFAIAWSLAGDDINKLGDWRAGGARFVGMVTTIGVVGGFIIGMRITRGVPVERGGFTLSFQRIEPTAAGYREMKTLMVDDLLAALRSLGYEPRANACDDTGTPGGPLGERVPLDGANIAIRDPRVRGWIRLQLSAGQEGLARALGVLETWSERGESTEELALYTLRSLDTLIGGLHAAREGSMLSHDPAALLTAGLDDRPRHR